MGAGKDTAAGFLKDYGFQRFAFADRLKELASELFGMKPGEKDRPLLAGLGRRMCELDRDVWGKHILGRMPESQRIVVTDMRFPAELELLRAAGFYIARVYCPQWLRLRRMRLGRVGQEWHWELVEDPSETALDARDDWDFTWNGGDTLATLRREVGEATAVMLAGEDH